MSAVEGADAKSLGLRFLQSFWNGKLEEEGYPGLVVHGPLIATLLTDLLRRERPEARLVKFAFTAVRPVFDINRFQVCGKPGEEPGSFKLWACDHEGALTMKADAEIA